MIFLKKVYKNSRLLIKCYYPYRQQPLRMPCRRDYYPSFPKLELTVKKTNVSHWFSQYLTSFGIIFEKEPVLEHFYLKILLI